MTAARILVAEDEFLVFLSLGEDLRDAGYCVVGPYASVDAARVSVAREEVDLALLDINMGGEMIWPAADAAIARNIPVIFLSGYEPSMPLPERFQGLPRLGKPIEPAILVREIRRELGA